MDVRRVVLRALSQRCLSASARSEILLPLDFLPRFLPCIVVPLHCRLLLCCNKTCRSAPRMLLLVYFFSTFFLYPDNFFPVLVFVMSFMSIVLLGPTRTRPIIYKLPNPQLATCSKPLCIGQRKLRLSEVTVSIPF